MELNENVYIVVKIDYFLVFMYREIVKNNSK